MAFSDRLGVCLGIRATGHCSHRRFLMASGSGLARAASNLTLSRIVYPAAPMLAEIRAVIANARSRAISDAHFRQRPSDDERHFRANPTILKCRARTATGGIGKLQTSVGAVYLCKLRTHWKGSRYSKHALVRNLSGCRPIVAHIGPNPVELAQQLPNPGRTASS